MGRPAHDPTPMSRRNVEALAGYGVPEADIAGVVGIDPKTLRRHYRSELKFGHVKANAKVAENLLRKATGDGRESVIAAIFWMKTRAQWKETSVSELAAKGGEPLTIVIRKFSSPVSDAERRTADGRNPNHPPLIEHREDD
jgi:hypothetical protein